MKIHFVAAISQSKQYGEYYKRIIKVLKNKGYEIVSDHIVDVNLSDLENLTDDDKIKHYKKVLSWLNKADIIVAETSFPSTVNVGHELSIALEKNKPVIVLYHKDKAPIFLEGIRSDKLFITEYTDSNLEETVIDAIDYASDQQDTRFNFFISPKIANYLDWVSKSKRLPRAVYLRRLIENNMRENKEFNEG